MWQVSDKVTSDTITAVTDKCQRDDCRLSARIKETTLVGTVDHYNKQGTLIVGRDSNSRTTEVGCGACSRYFNVHHSYGVVDRIDEITEEMQAGLIKRHHSF